MKRRKNNKNTSIKKQQPKIDDVSNNKNNITLKVRSSNCGKTYLLNYILPQKEEPYYIVTISLNQNPNIKAQISDEIESLERYEKTVKSF